ncbi:ABC transporter ATP-binding protein [Actinomycetota bacterium]|nr:ABC transporter ATP-binding protein [Actinomycetota bacterium]
MSILEIKKLEVEVEGKRILNGVDLTIKQGETHAIMGPNGSGKSTLSYAIAGHPKYKIVGGEILLDGTNISEASPDERAKAGIFLAQQAPTEIEGITLSNFLRAAVTAVKGEPPKVRDWIKDLATEMQKLHISKDFANRQVNLGFSGGEKKRTEILQLRMLKPKFAILDETDSGLDVDALKIVAEGVNDAMSALNFGLLLITHHTHLLRYIQPDFVHVFKSGKIVESGGSELAEQLVAQGYSKWMD